MPSTFRSSNTSEPGVPRVMVTLAGAAQPFLLDGRPVMFDETAQELLELNPAAAALSARLLDPVPLDVLLGELARPLGSLDAAEDLLLEWAATGLLDCRVDLSASYFHLAMRRRLPLGDHGIALHFGTDDFGKALALPYGHLPLGDDGADRRVAAVPHGNLAVVVATGRPSALVRREAAGPELRFALVELILADPRHVAIHGALLETPKGAVLLCGQPGAGKSTLAAELSRAGLALAGEDMVLLDAAQAAICAVPLPLTVKAGSWDRLAARLKLDPELPALPRADGQQVRYLPLPGAAGQRWQPLRAIVRLERRPATRTELVPQDRTASLRLLFADAYSPSGRSSRATVRALASLVEGAENLVLHYAEASEAAQLLAGRLAG